VRRLAQWGVLPAWERKAFLRLALLLPLVWVGLRTAGFSRMCRWAQAKPAAREPTRLSEPTKPETIQAARRYASLTTIAARHGLYEANCLHQALALCRLLRRQDISADLKVGVRIAGTALDAHAWVELDGQVLGEPVSGYQAFDRLGTPPKLAG
jgi:hypothetical protein